MKSLFLLAVGLLASHTSAFAANSETKLNTPLNEASQSSVRQMALEETAIIPTENKKNSTDASGLSTGMLSLKDPHQEINLRNWKYFLTLSAQSFSPRGSTSNDLGTQFNLNDQNSTVMPAIGLGASGNISQNERMNFGWGFGAKVGYASQNSTVTLPSGYRIDDSRLNTTEISLNPYLSFNTPQVAWLDIRAGYLLGTLNYTETSSDDFAKFSRQANFQGANLGADFHVGRRWSVLLDYSYKTLTRSDAGIDIPESSLEVGTRVIW